jgi:ABC-2 type transport system ATP-binding protein
MPAISLKNVTKTLEQNTLFDDVSFDFEEGRAYAIVGPNGVGKSVLLRMLFGLMRPDTGIVSIDPKFMAPRRVFPEKFGVTIDGPAYLPGRTGEANLLELASIRKQITREDVHATMERLGLDPKLKTKVRKYSVGMKQKLALSQALMENPEVLVLDEPFNGLDQTSVAKVTDILHRFVAAGNTLVFTSHMSANVEGLADVVVSVDDHKLVPAK